MNASETSEWIHGLRQFGVRPGLERIKRILAAFGNPEASLRFYHIAGTNGKGSVCAMLDKMLRSVGHRTGLFTSPGYGGLTGRMTVDGEVISEELFANHSTQVKAMVEAYSAHDPLTEFEVLTVIALLYFQTQAVDTVVWEAGLGGRYDSTNVVTPVVTAITNVSLDHVAILGGTIARIAYDKAGIIKPCIPVVTGADDTAYRVIEDVAQQLGAPILRVGREVAFTETYTRLGAQTRRHGFYRGIYRDFGGVLVSLFGKHQFANAAIALAVFELGETSLSTSSWTTAVQSLQHVYWPMRFEMFSDTRGRPIVVDGAHNIGAAKVLAKALDDFSYLNRSPRKWMMVVGVLSDKDASGMLEHLLPYASGVVVCEPQHVRALCAHDLAEKVRRLRSELSVQVIPNIEHAMRFALDGSNPVLIWGSLYMLEDARKTIAKMGIDYWTRGR